MISGLHSRVRRETGPRFRMRQEVIFLRTPLGLACPRLRTARSSRISASTASARASGSGGNGVRILQAPPSHAHGVGGTDPVRVLPGLSGRPADQAPHGAVREHQPVDLPKDQIRRLAPQRGSRPEQMGLDLVASILDLPPLVVQACELAGRGREASSRADIPRPGSGRRRGSAGGPIPNPAVRSATTRPRTARPPDAGARSRARRSRSAPVSEALDHKGKPNGPRSAGSSIPGSGCPSSASACECSDSPRTGPTRHAGAARVPVSRSRASRAFGRRRPEPGSGAGNRGLPGNPHRNAGSHEAETVREAAKDLARRDLAEQPHRDHAVRHRLQRKVAPPHAADAARAQRRFNRAKRKDLRDHAKSEIVGEADSSGKCSLRPGFLDIRGVRLLGVRGSAESMESGGQSFFALHSGFGFGSRIAHIPTAPSGRGGPVWQRHP